MNGRGEPPAVDDGDPSGLLETLRRELAPTPGRMGNTLRLLALVLATVTIGEVFRLPDLTVGACLALFVSGTEAGTAIMTSVLAGGALAIGSLATVVVFMVSLSEPALRLPLMALLTFAAGFLTRASPLGPAFLLFGFWVVYTTTQGDNLLLPALQPAVITNTADPATSDPAFIPPGNSATGSLPDLVFLPSQEALLHGILWLALVFIVSLLLIALANWLTGRDPALILRAALADRLAAAAAFCEGAPGSRERLAGLAKEGVAKFTKMHEMGSKLHRHARDQEAGAQLIQDIARLVLALLAWARVAPDAPRDPLHEFAQACRAAERTMHDGAPLPHGTNPDGGPRSDAKVPAAAAPLLPELRQAVQAIQRSLWDRAGAPVDLPEAVKEPNRLLAPDAFSNPDYVRFGLKLSLAVMTCYVLMRLTYWPGIQTIMVTCFFVSLETVGQTVHKMMLRIAGCLIGAALGYGTILLLMPVMTDLGDLLLVITPVMLLAGWIQGGSQRVSYVGPQIALAYFVCVLQGFGPTLDLQQGRDRVVGILLGNIVVFLVFTTFWPVSVADKVRHGLADAIERLADLLVLQRAEPARVFGPEEEKLRQRFGQAIAQAREVMVNDPYEPDRLRPDRGRSPIDAGVVTQVQALIVPVSVILGHQPGPARDDDLPRASRDAIRAHNEATSGWLRRWAAWVRDGEGAAELVSSLPELPGLDASAGAEADRTEDAARRLAAQAAWYGVLRQDIHAILDEVGPGTAPAVLQTQAAHAPA